MARLCRSEQCFAVTRVEYDVVEDVAQEVRAINLPDLTGEIAVKEPRALASGHADQDAPRMCRASLRRIVLCHACSFPIAQTDACAVQL